MLSPEPANNTCVQYGALPAQHPLFTCFDGSNLLCSSGTCALKNSGTPDEWACTIPLSNVNKIPNSCDTNNPCQSVSDPYFDPPYSIIEPCSCAWNKNGTSYCPAFPGDSVATDYLKYHITWLNSTNAQNCNTMRRSSMECIKDHWNTKSYNKHRYYYDYLYYYAQMQDAEECVKEVFMSDYEDAKNDADESAVGLIISSIFLISLI